MSMGDADAKFPNQHTGTAPSPTRENPGQVYPKSDPNPAPRKDHDVNENVADTAIGNPFLMHEALESVNKALDEVIAILESEERSQGRSTKEDELLRKFSEWKRDLFLVRSEYTKKHPPPSRSDVRTDSTSGGMFTD